MRRTHGLLLAALLVVGPAAEARAAELLGFGGAFVLEDGALGFSNVTVTTAWDCQGHFQPGIVGYDVQIEDLRL
ncbi:MAG: hypothetical protein JRG82_09835, partial [Deltaproteobacteria bacterium]|nr:hypothetical protein [Deltaproteobacteria bacterium]